MQLLSHHYGYAGDGDPTTPDSAVMEQVAMEVELVRQLEASGLTKQNVKQFKKKLAPQLKQLQRTAIKQVRRPMTFQPPISRDEPWQKQTRGMEPTVQGISPQGTSTMARDFGSTQEVFVDVRTQLKNIWSNRKEPKNLREQALQLAQTLELVQGGRLGEARDLIAQKAPNVQQLLATTNWEEWARTQAQSLGLSDQTEVLLERFKIATANAAVPEQSEASLAHLSDFDPALEVAWEHMKAQKLWAAAGLGAFGLWIIRHMYLNWRDQ